VYIVGVLGLCLLECDGQKEKRDMNYSVLIVIRGQAKALPAWPALPVA